MMANRILGPLKKIPQRIQNSPIFKKAQNVIFKQTKGKSNAINVHQSVNFGFPESATCCAVNETLGLLAIASQQGSITIVGKPGVYFVTKSLNEEIFDIFFLQDKDSFVTLSGNIHPTTVTLWEFHNNNWQISKKIKNNDINITCYLFVSGDFDEKASDLLFGCDNGCVFGFNLTSWTFSKGPLITAESYNTTINTNSKDEEGKSNEECELEGMAIVSLLLSEGEKVYFVLSDGSLYLLFRDTIEVEEEQEVENIVVVEEETKKEQVEEKPKVEEEEVEKKKEGDVEEKKEDIEEKVQEPAVTEEKEKTEVEKKIVTRHIYKGDRCFKCDIKEDDITVTCVTQSSQKNDNKTSSYLLFALSNGSFRIVTQGKNSDEGKDYSFAEIHENCPYSPFPCGEMGRIKMKQLGENDSQCIVFSGALPSSGYADRNAITMMQVDMNDCHSKPTTCFEFLSPVKSFDFVTFSGVDGEKSELLWVLCEEEFCFVDTQTWECITLPYLHGVGSFSLVTSLGWMSDIPEGLTKEFRVKVDNAVESCPLFGGHVSGMEDSSPFVTTSEALLTGHADGSVAIWCLGQGGCICLMEVFTTQAIYDEFLADVQNTTSTHTAETWPPFKACGMKTALESLPQNAKWHANIDYRPAISLLETHHPPGNESSLEILIATYSGLTSLWRYSPSSSSLSSPTKFHFTEANLLSELGSEAGEVTWLDKDPLKVSHHSFPTGTFSPTMACQMLPPAPVLSVNYVPGQGLLAIGTAHGFAVFKNDNDDNISVIDVKCTITQFGNVAIVGGSSSHSRAHKLKENIRNKLKSLRQTKRSAPVAESKKEEEHDQEKDGEEKKEGEEDVVTEKKEEEAPKIKTQEEKEKVVTVVEKEEEEDQVSKTLQLTISDLGPCAVRSLFMARTNVAVKEVIEVTEEVPIVVAPPSKKVKEDMNKKTETKKTEGEPEAETSTEKKAEEGEKQAEKGEEEKVPKTDVDETTTTKTPVNGTGEKEEEAIGEKTETIKEENTKNEEEPEIVVAPKTQLVTKMVEVEKIYEILALFTGLQCSRVLVNKIKDAGEDRGLSLMRDLKLKHGAPIMGLIVLHGKTSEVVTCDETVKPTPVEVEVVPTAETAKEGVDESAESKTTPTKTTTTTTVPPSPQHQLMVISEDQVKVFSLPSMEGKQKHRIAASGLLAYHRASVDHSSTSPAPATATLPRSPTGTLTQLDHGSLINTNSTVGGTMGSSSSLLLGRHIQSWALQRISVGDEWHRVLTLTLTNGHFQVLDLAKNFTKLASGTMLGRDGVSLKCGTLANGVLSRPSENEVTLSEMVMTQAKPRFALTKTQSTSLEKPKAVTSDTPQQVMESTTTVAAAVNGVEESPKEGEEKPTAVVNGDSDEAVTAAVKEYLPSGKNSEYVVHSEETKVEKETCVSEGKVTKSVHETVKVDGTVTKDETVLTSS